LECWKDGRVGKGMEDWNTGIMENWGKIERLE
jgi:hypothetical protein